MDRLLARLERTFLGRLAIERMITFVVGGMAMVFVLGLARPEFVQYLTLDPHLVASQPWRLVTYLFLPPSWSLIWTLFGLYFTWLIGANLEQEWGAFKLNVYYLLGAVGTTVAALVTGEASGNMWINLSLYFAFATLFPDFPVAIFFIIPMRIKWLAMISALLVLYEFVVGDTAMKIAIAVAFGNYLLFFGGHLWALARGQKLQMRQAARRSGQRSAAREVKSAAASRACAICGARQDDGADIRVCSCEKCGGPRDLCLEHARNH